MDETSKQLIGETRLPVDVAPGQPRRVDYEYERKGVADLFMFFEPLRGWRRVWIAPQRRKVEWAWCVKRLLEEHYTVVDPVLPSLWYDGCCSLGQRSQGEHRPLFLGDGTDRP
jgi:hypothetical protein